MNCISQYDINALKVCPEQDSSGDPEGLDGLETIPATFKAAILKILNDGKLIEVAKNEPEDPPKKSRAKMSKADEKDDEKPKRGRKKRTTELMEVDSNSEPEYVPKKTRGRRNIEEETVDPAVSNIEALAAAMRENAGGG